MLNGEILSKERVGAMKSGQGMNEITDKHEWTGARPDKELLLLLFLSYFPGSSRAIY